MIKKNLFGVLFFSMLAPAAFAGRMELTTYYPAPFGEYENITSNRMTLGNDPGGGGAATPGVLTFVGRAGDPTDFTFPSNATIPSGSLFYDTTGEGQFKYKDNTNNWINFSKPEFGDWVDSYGGSAFIKGSDYQAPTDGFVMVNVTCASSQSLKGYTDASSHPVTQVLWLRLEYGGDYNLIFPVKAKDWWRVEFDGSETPSIQWMSLD